MHPNTLNSIFLIALAICIPVYHYAGHRSFSFYLGILLGGTFLQRLGSAVLWQYSQPLSLIWYEFMGIIISTSFIIFILRRYFHLKVFKETKFLVFIITSMLGFGLRAVRMEGSYNSILSLGLVYNLLIVVLGIAYVTHLKVKKFYRIDGGLFFTFFAPPIYYVIGYVILKNTITFYMVWAWVLLIQSAFWVLIGLSQWQGVKWFGKYYRQNCSRSFRYRLGDPGHLGSHFISTQRK